MYNPSRNMLENRTNARLTPISCNDSMPNAPVSGNRFVLNYAYEIGGKLKSYTDPFGQQIAFAYDAVGRISAMTGSTFGGVTNYASNPEYRAWGGLKKLDSASGLHMQFDYDDRLAVNGMRLQKTSDSSYVMNKTYNYYADGKLRFLDDLVNPKYDRLNTYDHAGRIKEGKSGGEARGETVATNDQEMNLPYRQSYSFDAFGNMTQANNLHWGVNAWQGQSFNQTNSYVNNRIQKTGWVFDEDGRITKSIDDNGKITNSTFNAAGKPVMGSTTNSGLSVTHYDGNGDEVKREVSTINPGSGLIEAQPTKYYIRSSVMKGRVLSEVWASGKKHRTYAKGPGNMTAVQTAYYYATSTLNESVVFEYGSRIADLPGFGTNWGSFLQLDMQLHEERVWNATHGLGFNPNEFYGGPPGARLIGFTLRYGNGSGPDGYWTTYEGAANNREGNEDIIPVWEENDILDLDFAQSNNLGGGIDDRELQTIMKEAVSVAQEALRNRPECRRLLDGYYDASTVLKDVNIVARPQKDYEKYRAFAYPKTSFNKGTIELYADFFRTGTFFGMGVVESRALTILHELGHVTWKYWHASQETGFSITGGGIVAPKLDLSNNEVNRQIYEKCFKSNGTTARGALGHGHDD